jgi:hypothetical protein
MALLSFGNVASGFGVVASVVWIGQFARNLIQRGRRIRLSACEGIEPDDGWPSLAVIVAARDEEAMIESSIRSLLAQDYPALEIIAIDDRSSDRTGTLLDALAREDHRLQAVHITDLPSGWLGKTNALQQGADASIARWLLFTDADVIFAPGVLRRAVALAEEANLDHLIASWDPITPTIGERMFMALFTLMLVFKSSWSGVEDRDQRTSIGAGAFNLVRAEVFETIGGFRRIKLSIDEDMRLGQAIKYAGYRAKVVDGIGQISLRWQVGLGGMIRGLEKNFFAALDFRLPLVFATAVAMLFLTLAPMLGLFVGPLWTRVVCGLGIAATAGLLSLVTTGRRNGWIYALALPLSGPIMVYALLRSAFLTIGRKGVTWRGRLYPLHELRAHVGLRNYWLHEVWHSTR